MPVHDLLPYYATLNITDRLSDGELAHYVTNIDEMTEQNKALCSLILKDTDGHIANVTAECRSGHYNCDAYIEFKGPECFYDIKISGLTPNDYDSIKFVIGGDTEICDGVCNAENNIIEFPDFTRMNPIFFSMMGSSLQVQIKGLKNVDQENIKCNYKEVWLGDFPRKVFMSNGPWAITKVPSKSGYALAGHMWCPSVFVPYCELELIKPENKLIVEEHKITMDDNTCVNVDDITISI